jgi:hypothetical protein
MRRFAASALVFAAACLPTAALAKFGISKTKITLQRTRPPELQLVGETVAIEVDSDSRRVTDSELRSIRDTLEDAFRDSRSFRLIDDARDADNRVRVTVELLEARVRESVVYEEKYVKTGERREWNDKKQKWETKDVWGNRKEPVDVTKADGRVDAQVEVANALGTRSADAGESYQDEWKGSAIVPSEAHSEDALERHLMDRAGHHAAATVSFTAEPLEVLLAVDGELKAGNGLAESSRFEEALAEWSRLSLKGDKEAARLHNLGVAHEALAYRLPMNDPQHRRHLEEADRLYQQARRLDSDEKYFAPPLERIQASLSAANAGERFWAELDRSREAKAAAIHRPTPVPPPAARPAPAKPPAAPAQTKTARPATPGPLRNGSFEAGLAPWTVDGNGTVAVEPKRGKVLELAAASGAASASQRFDLELGEWPSAQLSLEYRVLSGEPQIRIQVSYADGQGKERTSTIEISAGEGTVGWSTWETELTTLRPRPARIRGLRPLIEGGSVRFDNLALTLK